MTATVVASSPSANGPEQGPVMTPEERDAYVMRQAERFRHNTLQGQGLKFERVSTKDGVHPYDEVSWQRRDVVMTNWRDGQVNFEQRGVEFPDFWSVNAANIVTTKYFRGAQGSPLREWSLRQLIDRVVDTYTVTGQLHGYFATPEDAGIFSDELKYALLHQEFSFNSPVWFNVGTTAPQQVSACFILAVEDTMDSILNWYREEGLIFKGGSGAGLNLSRIRSSRELLRSSGGTPSGPVSFMRGADASAGTIQSGGATRRAAKMVILDVDHPDVEEFIETKRHEENKIRLLRDNGFDMDIGGRDIISVQYQNANNSVRVNDEFMRAVESGGRYALLARVWPEPGAVVDTLDAKELFGKIAQAAWECADPGLQYDDTINDWHTCPETGRITASNPCSEYMHLDNSSCNLASINLLKFLEEDGTFDIERFVKLVELAITAMDISICFADFPTQPITETTWRYRQLGLGYANLGALLMACGLPYDSQKGRDLAAAITALMQGAAYRCSAELAGVVGPYEGYARNADAHQRVIRKHTSACDEIGRTELNRSILAAATQQWEQCQTTGKANGYRNAQASVLAPTGTIGLMMDCDTTGVEPDMALVKEKKLVGGGSMEIVNKTVDRALRSLGYQDETVEAVVDYVKEYGNVVDAPGLKAEHYAVFDCAMGERSIEPMGHVRMMAAVQPFISGAISKTVNMPQTATVEEVAEMYFQGWKLGLKAIAIYRDKCKASQPLNDAKAKPAAVQSESGEGSLEALEKLFKIFQHTSDFDTRVRKVAEVFDLSEDDVRQRFGMWAPVRRRLPKRRPSQTVSFTVGGAEAYMIAGSYPDDGLGEVFLKFGKQGSTLSGVMDAFSIAVSIALQYGVPLETYVQKFTNMKFEPAGPTDDSEIRIAQSVMDYIFRRLAVDYLDPETRLGLGIQTAEERTAAVNGTYGAPAPAADLDTALDEQAAEVPVQAGPKPVRSAPLSLADKIRQDGGAPTSREQAVAAKQMVSDAPLCMTCGVKMRPAGSCYVCESCGSTSGCS